jgi:ferric-dicitrate binding protein FerR (iron transport regulator)
LVYQIRQQQLPKTAYQLRTESVQQTLTEVRNDEQRNKSVPLSDGSVVELKPGSRVSFPKTFDARQREVYLTGEAFFQVAKNPNQPFYVYANELVVRVLGTSFTVSAFDLDKQVKVMVKTGKVSVFANQAVQKTKPQTANLILTPNQQAVFDRVNLGLKKSVVTTPEPLVAATEMGSLFHFNRTPITTVYKRLEQVYGVPIVYDAEVQKGCELSAELGDESLYDKISLICKATGSQYEIIDGQIVIYSKGCLQ